MPLISTHAKYGGSGLKFINSAYTRRYFPVLTGLIQGLVFFIAYSLWGNSSGSNAWLASAVYFVSACGLSLHLTRDAKNSLRSYAMAGSLGLLTALAALWVWSQMPELTHADKPHLYLGDDLRTNSYIFAAVIINYVLIAYQQVYRQGGDFSFPYQELFRHSWNNFFIILVGAIFTGILWGLVAMCAALFNAVNITLFHDIFISQQFAFIATPAFFGLGMSIGRDNTQIINTLRNVAMSVIRVLLPVLAVIAIGFMATLPFTGLAPLWATKRATYLALGMVAIAVVFMNAVFQDGRPEPPYRKWLLRVVEALIVLLPVYALISIFSMWMRIDQYGFTPMRVYALTCAIIALLYAAGYAASVFIKSIAWMGAMRKVNVVMSIAVAAVAVLLHTPLLDPLTISANNQFGRLTEGRVDPKKFDYAQMRFSFGRVGYEKLKELEASVGGAEARTIKEMVAATWKLNSKWDKPGMDEAELKPSDIKLFPRERKLPGAVFSYLRKKIPDYESRGCAKKKDCMLIALNMDSDPEDEYLFVVSGNYYHVRLLDRAQSGRWEQAAVYSVKSAGSGDIDGKALLNEFTKKGVKTAPRKYRDISVGRFSIEHGGEGKGNSGNSGEFEGD